MLSTEKNLEILYEDNHLIAINKRAGDIVQGDSTGDEPLNKMLMAFLKEKYNKPGNVYLGVPHRLDRPTSGVLLFAKTSKAAARLAKLFSEQKVIKEYWAVTANPPPRHQDQIVHFLKRNTQQNKSYASDKKTEDSKIAKLDYTILQQHGTHYLLSVNLLTGRHHQIRCQLSFIGCPIVGDVKYGSKTPGPDGSIHLHAKRLSFSHPVTKILLNINAPLPQNGLWKKLRH